MGRTNRLPSRWDTVPDTSASTAKAAVARNARVKAPSRWRCNSWQTLLECKILPRQTLQGGHAGSEVPRHEYLRRIGDDRKPNHRILYATRTEKDCEEAATLRDVGLGYINQLGQASSTLSGGENQRVKLAFYLSQEKADPTMFIFDEPTTGLHFHDIKKLLEAFDALIRRGHSIVIIEHNLDVVKCADHVIDLGPEGGTKEETS